jgi:DNA-binding transcriptional regulator YhcF (GntR family)
MTIELRLDPEDPTPSYEQLRRQLSAVIQSGMLAPQTRLPTVRQLAADLGVAAGTVMRAYAELEGEGLVVTRRGGGTAVSDAPPALSDMERTGRLTKLAISLVTQARRLGATDDEISRVVDSQLG